MISTTMIIGAIISGASAAIAYWIMEWIDSRDKHKRQADKDRQLRR